MFKRATLSELMREELPSIGYQKKLCYRTDYSEVVALYNLINKTIFNSKLVRPEIEVLPRCREYWGMCYVWEGEDSKESLCKIRMMDKWYCRHWLITSLAHEMCHQYQWEIDGDKRVKKGKDRILSHGPSFFKFRNKLSRQGIPLKIALSNKEWFKYQNLFKC